MALKYMLEIETWSAFCEIERQSILELFDHLDSEGYRSVSLAAARGVSNLLGDSKDRDAAILGRIPTADRAAFALAEPVASDMFLPEEACVLHIDVSSMTFTANDARKSFLVSAVYAGSERPPVIDEFISKTQQLLRKLGILPDDETLKKRETTPDSCEENLEKLPDLTTPPKLTKRTVIAAATLSDKANRELVLDIKSKSLATLDDYIGKKGGPAEPKATREKIDELVDAGLLELSVAAFCKKSSRPVVVGTREEIAGSKVHCPTCKNLPKDENIVEIIVGTNWSETLVLKSRWMMVLAIFTLVRSGVAQSSIRAPAEDARTDLLDLAFCFDGKVHLVELKDDEFRKQHAAIFAPRLMQLSSIVNVGVVACTGSAEDDAKELIGQFIGGRDSLPGFGPAPQRCTFLDGQQCMTLELQDFLRHERLRAAATVTTLHGAAAGIDTWVLIYKKLLE